MVRLSGGRFLMGSEDADVNPCDGEGPLREVSLSPYWIGRCAVTNAEFAQFVNSTGYRTGAERLTASRGVVGFRGRSSVPYVPLVMAAVG